MLQVWCKDPSLPSKPLATFPFPHPWVKRESFSLVTVQNLEALSLTPLPGLKSFKSVHPVSKDTLPKLFQLYCIPFDTKAAPSNPTHEQITHQLLHFLLHPWGIPKSISGFKKGRQVTDIRDFSTALSKGRAQCPDPAWPWIQGPQGEQSTSCSIRRRARKLWSILSKQEELTTANAEFKLLNTFLHQ